MKTSSQTFAENALEIISGLSPFGNDEAGESHRTAITTLLQSLFPTDIPSLHTYFNTPYIEITFSTAEDWLCKSLIGLQKPNSDQFLLEPAISSTATSLSYNLSVQTDQTDVDSLQRPVLGDLKWLQTRRAPRKPIATLSRFLLHAGSPQPPDHQQFNPNLSLYNPSYRIKVL